MDGKTSPRWRSSSVIRATVTSRRSSGGTSGRHRLFTDGTPPACVFDALNRWLRVVRILLIATGVAAVVATVRPLWRSVDGLSAADYYLVYVNAQIAGRSDIADPYSEEAQHVVGEEFFQRALVSGSPLFHENASMRRSLDSRGSPFLYASLGWMGD